MAAVQSVGAFLEDTPPTLANGSVNPNRTGDPAAVAAAQRALDELFTRIISSLGLELGGERE
jgi:hypothetical protein